MCQERVFRSHKSWSIIKPIEFASTQNRSFNIYHPVDLTVLADNIIPNFDGGDGSPTRAVALIES